MGEATNQLWLTSAITDEDAPKALILCFSLKRTLSTRKIGVIASQKVSTPMRKALRQAFDFFFCLDENEETRKGLKTEDFLQLYTLTLKPFEKVVYLKPTMLAIKNSDEIFENVCNTASKFVWGKAGGSSIFLVRPCLQTFGILMEALQTGNKRVERNEYLKTLAKNQKEMSTFLDAKYSRRISPEKDFDFGNETDVSIIEIFDIPFDNDDDTIQEFGFLAKLILEQQKLIYTEDVQPLLKSVGKSILSYPNELTIPYKEPIAIIGMSCRYPNANNIEEFWRLLLNGEDGTGTPPDFRWRPENWLRGNATSSAKTNAGFLKYAVEDFDSKFFGISPKEMEFLDPQHRLLHELVWEGLEDAAVNPQGLNGTNGGVFIGSWTNDYKDLLTLTGNMDIYRKHMGNSIGAAAARISHLLGLTGPSLATESGCSSAMVAVHLACKSLQRGESNLALACGVNLLLRPFDESEMPMMVSPDGHCKTFDAKANGFARAEGCGVLVLKRMSDAVKDGDKIWGLIRGSGLTQEGVSKSMGTPTVHCESLAMEQALQDARVDPKDVSYVEAHGTGTVVGDPFEVMSIAKAYHSKERKEPLLIGSVKTNVGHTESCSGITGIMKVVLAMNHEIIPPHRNFDTLNPAIDLDAVPAQIPLKPVEWPRMSGKSRYAGVSSFGITGSDSHVIIEEPRQLPANALVCAELERPLHIMKISAKTEEALDLLLEKYKSHFMHDESEFYDLAFTANVGRADFGHRAVIIANSKEDAVKKMEENKFVRGEAALEEIGKVCFLFTGQGSQYPGMAKQLYETSPVFRMHFEYCERILKNTYNIDITQVLWSEAKSGEVSRTIYSQTSIFCVEYALLKLWESWGVKPDFALGHSLGEFAAAVCAGILNVEDAIKLVAERSRLIDLLPHGQMLVIKADKQRVDSLMTKFAGNEKNRLLDYAALNSPEQTVVAGDSELIMKFSEFCNQANLKCIVLEATHAFHSKHMNPMLNDYRSVAQSVKSLDGNNCKYISGMRGTRVEAEDVDAQYWVEHTREKVLFLDASKKAVELGCRVFIEVGPQPVLSALTMMNSDTQQLTCLPSLKKNENEWETLLSTLAKLYLKGMEIDWKGFEQFYNRNKVQLPHYPFVGKKFWPKIREASSTTIHPLLGSVIPNASPTKLFQSGLDLRVLEWVKDHCIGDNIIFPGAGFLEMCLAAGHATVQNCTHSLPPPRFGMKVENLVIQAPLQLQDSKVAQIQTVVEVNSSSQEVDSTELTVKIYRSLESESGSKWLAHAQASFSSVHTPELNSNPFENTSFKETIQKPCNETLITEFYSRFHSLGLKFGPVFKNLEKVWQNETSSSIIAKVKLPPRESSLDKYIVHPVVLDAMLQAIMMFEHGIAVKKVHLPIKIEKFIWLSGTESTELYIEAGEGAATLVDADGKLLAVMSSVEIVETTVNALESVLEQQTTPMPEIWEEVWKSGPLELPVDLEKASGMFYSTEVAAQMEKTYNQLPTHLSETFSLLDRLAYLYILRALYDCGWKPEEEGELLEEESLFAQLKIQKNFMSKYFTFTLNVLQSKGVLKKVEGAETRTWELATVPLSPEEVDNTLNSLLFSGDLVGRFRSTLLLSKFGENLADILRGEQSALSILFPEGSNGQPNVTDFYLDYGEVFKQSECRKEICSQRLSHIREAMKGQRFILKILEVGAGTGSYSSHFLKCLEEEGIEFEYTYTDISPGFFPAAEKRFEKYGNRIKFQKLNIEEDPIDQGFTPEYFDYVLAAEVVHATRDIRETLRNLRMLMKPYAKLDLQEGVKQNTLITYLFGALEGFWRYQDFDTRQDHCLLSIPTWESVFKRTGFEINGIFPMMNGYHAFICVQKSAKLPCPASKEPPLKNPKTWLAFHDSSSIISNFLITNLRETTARKVIVVSAGNTFEACGESFMLRKSKEGDYTALLNSMNEQGLEVEGILYCWALANHQISQEEILQPYFYLTKALLTSKFSTTLKLRVLMNEAVVPLESNELSHFHTSTLWGFTKSLKNENPELDCRCIELVTDLVEVTKMQEVFFEIWRDAKETIVAFDGNSWYIPKLQRLKVSNKALNLPKGTERFQLILPETNSISDLQFGPLAISAVEDNEVEVHVKASALNFRDVLSVLKPTEQFKNLNVVGEDFAGVIKRVGSKVTKWRAGDRVCGAKMENCTLPSHVTHHQDLLIGIPKHMTFCEAASIPIVYVTSIVCLIEAARITNDDFVLIHTASGGVGLSAIEICKHVGCTIVATAGSKRKQNYLRGLGIQHVFHSRNTKYGDQILELTNGRGVDIVLNSLTSPGLKEATLKACAKGARFVEMSKLNIWTKEEVKKLRPDVEYSTVDISSAGTLEWARFMSVLRGFMEKQVVKSIPCVRFDALNIRDALEHMQNAKHIGKVVCVMPQLISEKGNIKVSTPRFDENSTYLITGGLRGIGFRVCQWMVENGAKHLLLAGRSVPTQTIQNQIAELNLKGAKIIPVQLDVENFEECRDLIQFQIAKMSFPPLKGIMHSAGTLADGLIVNQDWNKLCSTFATKIKGTLNLHELTKSINLEHFVLFSSIASLFGSGGQANHAAGNCFEDAFTHYRRSIGLPASTINWGPWSEVGVATDVEIPCLKSLSNLQGLAGLEYVLKSQRTQTGIFNVSSFQTLSKLFPNVAGYLDESVWKKNSSSGGQALTKSITKSESSLFWQQYGSALEPEEKVNVLQIQLQNILRNTLKLDENEVVGDNVDMQEMGVDSLMFVEIRNSLQTLLGERLKLTAGSIRDCNTVSQISNKVFSLIEGTVLVETERLPTALEVNELMREDSQLPENIKAKRGQKIGTASEIKRVLLTGCTGTLGPYLFKQLTNLQQISQVICLMRPVKRSSGEERLNKILNNMGLLPHVDMEKVAYVSGNVAKSRLGMEPGVWEELSQSVDAVVNCAANVQHIGYYRAQNSSQTDMRAVNIGGARNILEFACENKLKHVYHASTILAVAKIDEETGHISEKWPELGDFDGMSMLGYPITKFVGDLLMKEANGRGIPCKVFRFPILGGESKTGRCSIDSNHNHGLLRQLFIMKNGMMPSAPCAYPLLPIDTCAEVSLQLFFDENAPPDLYNIIPCKPDLDEEFVNVAKGFGYHVNIVQFSEFSKRVLESSADKGKVSALEMFKEIYADVDEQNPVLAMSSNSPIMGMGGGDDLKKKWWSNKVAKFAPAFFQNQKQTMEYVRQDLMFCKSQGWFDKFGLEPRPLNTL